MGSDIVYGIAYSIALLHDKLEEYYMHIPTDSEDDREAAAASKNVLDSITHLMDSDDLIHRPDELNALINGWIRPIVRHPGIAYPEQRLETQRRQ